MLVKVLTISLSIASAVNAAILAPRATCNADNCLRALRATQLATRSLLASQDCTSALYTTVTPGAVTVTESSTTTITYLPVAGPFKREIGDDFVLPEYASACSGFSRFSSACGCMSVFPSTIVAEAPTTTSSAITIVTPVSFRLGVFSEGPSYVAKPVSELWVGAENSNGVANLKGGPWSASSIFTLDIATGYLYFYDNVGKGKASGVNSNRFRMYGPGDTVPTGYNTNYKCWFGGFRGFTTLNCKLPNTDLDTFGYKAGEGTSLFVGKHWYLDEPLTLRVYTI
ncbi:hypothetical protein ABW19_dt0205362 [Dactylella cylindrospora]|nr:hypothetical protein ABW19_dt0205362 [Dactylella cylindrospora]